MKVPFKPKRLKPLHPVRGKRAALVERPLGARPIPKLRIFAPLGRNVAVAIAGWRRSVEEATEYEIQNVMKSVRHPYFRQALDRFIAGEQKSDAEQVRLP